MNRTNVKRGLQLLISISVIVVSAFDLIMGIYYVGSPYIDTIDIVYLIVVNFVFNSALVVLGIISIKTYKLPLLIVYSIRIGAGVVFGYFCSLMLITDTAIVILSLMIFEKVLFAVLGKDGEDISGNKSQTPTANANSFASVEASSDSVLVVEKSANTNGGSDNKSIVKTKIIDTHQRETAASKKKGKFLSALASGLTAGFGGSSSDIMEANAAQNVHNIKNAKYETVITFLVIYTDGSRETVETVKGDDKYNEYIMYVE